MRPASRTDEPTADARGRASSPRGPAAGRGAGGRVGSIRLGPLLMLALAAFALALALSRLGGSPAPLPGEPAAPPRLAPSAEGLHQEPRALPLVRATDERSSAGEPLDTTPTQAPAPGPLEGSVRDELGAPIGPPAPRLELAAADGRVVSVPVDPTGRWRLDAFAPGTWELTARADGHLTERVRLEVGPDQDRAPIEVVLRRVERVVVRLETPGGPADPVELQDALRALAPFLELRLGEARAVPRPARRESLPQEPRWGLQATIERGAGTQGRVEVRLGDLVVTARELARPAPRELVIALDPAELSRRLVRVRLHPRESVDGEPLRPSSAFLRAADAGWVLEADVDESGTCSLDAVPPGPATLVLTLPDGSARRAALVIPAEGPAELDVVPDA